MFTGLIEDVGELIARRNMGNAAKLGIKTDLPCGEIAVGDSICVNGACLTVEHIQVQNGTLTFHALSETLGRTNLGSLPKGSRLNLERSLRAGDRLGGHFVMGHVDCTAQVIDVKHERSDLIVQVQLPENIRSLVIPKGSIAVDGISLTIANLVKDAFSVHVIPHTWQNTNLQRARSGTVVNLEADMLGKYILRSRQVQGTSAHVSMETLEQAGFA